VSDRVTALDLFPGAVLIGAALFFFTRMPADGRRVEENFRALQRGQTRRFGIPLVPANADANFGVARLPRAETQIARREIKLFVEQRVVRDVHLAIDAEQRTVGV